MIKKFLSATLFGFLALGFAGTFVACDDYDDSNLRMRVEAVEGTLADLQAQIKNGAIIKSVSQAENGITITFSDGKTFNITNGKDGAAGAAGQDGKPGSVVEIGENGNWFIDGQDTGMPSRGDKGDKGDQGDKGDKGDKGDTGATGAAGLTPTISINSDGYWVINGETTTIKAAGEKGDKGDKGDQGEQGPQGTPGTSTEITIIDGYWAINGVKTDYPVTGPAGITPTIEISEDGYWVINGVKTETPATGPQGPQGPQGPAGITPTIEISEDGYWVINGVKTETPATGPQGPQGPAGANGADADIVWYEPGVNGDEDGFWVKVTVPAGSIEQIREVTDIPWLPEGTITAVYDTETWVLTLCNVAGAEDNRVQISLAEPLVGLSLVPDVLKDGMAVVRWYSLQVKEGENYKDVLTNPAITMIYRLNPSNAYTTGINWSFIGRQVMTRAAGDDALQLTVNGTPTVSGGELTISALPVGIKNLPADSAYIFALQANDAKGRVITSDYGMLEAGILKDYNLASDKGVVYPATKPEYSTSMTTYRDVVCTTKELDLNKIVDLWETNLNIIVEEAGFDVNYTFTIEAFKDGSNVDQNEFIKIDDKGVMSITNAYASVGRKPMIKVEAKVNNTLLATAYMVLNIVATEVEDNKITVTADEIVVDYAKLGEDGKSYTETVFDYAMINDSVYTRLGNVTAANFNTYYKSDAPVIAGDAYEADNKTNAGINIGTLPGKADDAEFITFRANNKVKLGEGMITITYAPQDIYANVYPSVEFIIPYNVVDNCDLENTLPAHSDWYIDGEYIVSGQLINNGTTYEMSGFMYNAYTSFNDWLAQAEQVNNHTLKFVAVDEESEVATISEGAASEQKITLNDAWTEEVTYGVRLVADLANGETETVEEMTVRFINPFAFGEMSYEYESKGTDVIELTDNLNSLVRINDADTQAAIFGESGIESNRFKLANGDITFSYKIATGNTNNFSIGTAGDGKPSLTFDPLGSPVPSDQTVQIEVTATVKDLVVMTGTINVTVKK